MTATITDTEQIRALLDEQITGLAELDADKVVGVYADDLVLYNLAPPLVHTGPTGWDVATWMTGFDGPIRSEVRDLEIVVDGDVAFTHCLRSMTATPKGSEQFTMWFRATNCLRRIDGTWKITHQHESTPFHMDGSFRAAIDLLP